MNTPEQIEIPSEELKRIKADAEDYRLKAMMGGSGLSIFPYEVYIHAAKAEFQRHLSTTPSIENKGVSAIGILKKWGVDASTLPNAIAILEAMEDYRYLSAKESIQEKGIREAYYAGFNQAHYSHLHPDVCPPKEIESAADEYIASLPAVEKPFDIPMTASLNEVAGKMLSPEPIAVGYCHVHNLSYPGSKCALCEAADLMTLTATTGDPCKTYNASDYAPGPEAGENREVPEFEKMSDRLSVEADIAAIDFGRDADPLDGLDGSELTDAFEAGQNWMWRKLQAEISSLKSLEADKKKANGVALLVWGEKNHLRRTVLGAWDVSLDGRTVQSKDASEVYDLFMIDEVEKNQTHQP